MRTRIIIMAALALGLSSAGCGASARMIAGKAQAGETDVFMEVTDAGAAQRGFADVVLKADIKTHAAGYYIGESCKSLHGKPDYPFVLNIDGQAVVWNVTGRADALPEYDEQGRTSRDPEAGAGVRYVLEKKLRLRSGTHKVFFGLPGDGYYTEVVVELKDGEVNLLEFKPLYRHKARPVRMPAFKKGIDRYQVYFNGGKARE